MTTETTDKASEDTARDDLDLAYWAWTIIANAGCGATHDDTIGWHNESPDWQEAAAKWRDAFHATLKADA